MFSRRIFACLLVAAAGVAAPVMADATLQQFVDQSLAQARNKWGDHAASTIWDASIVKIILGGASASKDLQELSTLIGDRDERTDSVTIGDHGQRSLQRSTRRVAVMPPERIRTLHFGTGLVLLRSAPPIVADLRRWTSR